MTSRRPCWWSRSFSPLGTKLYFQVNSWRKNYIVLTFNIITFFRGCKPRITSYLIVGSIWPDTMPQRAYPRDLQFCLFLVVYSPPPGMQKETIPHPRAPDQPYICVLGYIFSRAKLISINFSKLMCWVDSYPASSILFVTGLCIITPRPSPCQKYQEIIVIEIRDIHYILQLMTCGYLVGFLIWLQIIWGQTIMFNPFESSNSVKD